MYELAKYLAERIAQWDFEQRPVHCTNCKHAKVGGTAAVPTVVCAKGQSDKTLPLIRVLAANYPASFRPAERCPDFCSMSD